MKKYINISFFMLFFISGCMLAPEDKDTSSSESQESSENEIATLLITEVGSTYYIDSSVWFEVYNPSTNTVNLNNYKLRCTGTDTNGATYILEISLPSLNINPGSYIIVRGKPYDGLVNGERIVYVSFEDKYPYWQDYGFVELIYNNQTIDFVKFGSNAATLNPISPDKWQGEPAAALPFNYGLSLARDASLEDSNSSNDWKINTPTPGGPNDITNTNDSDVDGIPDCSEIPNGTFAGLPLYQWGARTNQKDIFIHVCYMGSTDKGVIPRGEALDKVVETFAKKGIKIHFDVGNLNLSGQATNNHNLDNENHRVPLEIPITVFTETGFGNLHKYKVNYMDLRKRQIFHFLLFAYSQNTDGSAGPSGIAELPGNDFVVSLGGWGLNSSNEIEKNILINFQAATIMHELGHNLGLQHGGNTDENYKPNYYSIMNYMYQIWGLPEIGNEREGDRYYFYRWIECGDTQFSNLYFPNAGYLGEELHRGPTNKNMVIDYSDGNGSQINEFNFSESAGLGRTSSAGVDFNGDGDRTDTLNNFNLNPTEGSSISNLSDYNDWANLNLFFSKTYFGDIQGAKLKSKDVITMLPDTVGNDLQPIHFETLMPPKIRGKK